MLPFIGIEKFFSYSHQNHVKYIRGETYDLLMSVWSPYRATFHVRKILVYSLNYGDYTDP